MSPERSILVVTTARADWGHLRSLAREIHADPRLELRLLVSGSHLTDPAGASLAEIAADGVPIWRQVPIEAAGDDEQASLTTVGNALLEVAPLLAAERPDLMVLLGDRTEIMAFALAALLLRIPLAHLHGGEVTGGAVDESIRHAVTKLATYHFVATEAYATNVRQLGEDPRRIFTVGAPGLDSLRDLTLLDRDELFSEFDLPADRPTALVAFHPVSTESRETVAAQTDALLEALEATDLQAVITGAGPDAHGQLVNDRLAAAAAGRPDRFRFRTHLGRLLFFSCLRHCDLMLGNSSAGLIEAPSFGLPVVNVGDRQAGRIRAENVLEAPARRGDLLAAVARARDAAFRARCRAAVNPYAPGGDEPVGRAIKETLAAVSLAPEVLKKVFRPLEEDHA